MAQGRQNISTIDRIGNTSNTVNKHLLSQKTDLCQQSYSSDLKTNSGLESGRG